MRRRRPGGRPQGGWKRGRPPLDPRPEVAAAAQRIWDMLPIEGLRLSEVIARTGLPDLLALRGALLLEQGGFVRWAGGRIVPQGEG